MPPEQIHLNSWGQPDFESLLWLTKQAIGYGHLLPYTLVEGKIPIISISVSGNTAEPQLQWDTSSEIGVKRLLQLLGEKYGRYATHCPYSIALREARRLARMKVTPDQIEDLLILAMRLGAVKSYQVSCCPPTATVHYRGGPEIIYKWEEAGLRSLLRDLANVHRWQIPTASELTDHVELHRGGGRAPLALVHSFQDQLSTLFAAAGGDIYKGD